MDSDKRMFLKQDLEAAGLNETEIENELFEFDRRQEYPLEDIYEEIEEIVNDIYFGLALEYENQETVFEDNYYCTSCGAMIPVDISLPEEIQAKTIEDLEHFDICKIVKLRSLVNTLGDMIA